MSKPKNFKNYLVTMNIKRMVLHAVLPALLLGVFALNASQASAASKKKQKTQPIRVACVGNSITYGTGIEDRAHDSYPSQLQRDRKSVV